MRTFSGKLVLALCLLLILSQWLTLAHATGHLVNTGDTDCQVCTLQHHFQSATVSVAPCITDIAQETIPYSSLSPLYTTTPDTTRPIRAPPQYPHN